MAKPYRYNVYDNNGNEILHDARKCDVCEWVGNKNFNPLEYAENNWRVRREYTIKISKSIEQELEKRYAEVKNSFSRQMFNEWIYMNERYGANA